MIYPDELVRQGLDLKDTRDWKINIARESVKQTNWREYIRPYPYHPFDNRRICYLPNLVDRGSDRWDLMKKFFEESLGLVTTRQLSTGIFRHIFVSSEVSDMCLVSIKTKETGYVFPLYVYPDIDKKDLFSHKTETAKREPNINPELFKTLSEVYKKELSPEEIFYYIYAFLYSNIYRTKYAEFLRIDFPRIPFIKDYKLFSKMGEYGKRLVDLHLLKSGELDPPIAKFQGKGESKVEKVKYDKRENRVYFNQSQYFEGITKEVWQYQIGSYQVCDKWLRDRKERRLSLDDIKHYSKIATSLQKTIEIQKAIDEIYPEAENETVEFENE